MRDFSIKYTSESPNRIYEIHGAATISELQILEQQIKDNEKNVCKHGRGLYSFTVVAVSGGDTMILNKGSEYVSGHNYILTLRNYDPNC
jgi:hypothetical protein